MIFVAPNDKEKQSAESWLDGAKGAKTTCDAISATAQFRS